MREAIEKIMSEVTDEYVICSLGYISREVYRAKDRSKNMYILGGMSCALAFGLGLAYSRPDLRVKVISGEGATLMGLNTVALYDHLNLPNIKHYILDNDCYASTGGQKTCPFNVSDRHIVIKCGKTSDAPRIPLTCQQIKERFIESICLKKK
mgnify:CR=1 FL=1